MKKVLLVGMLLAVCATTFAQTDDPGCNIVVTLSDKNCTTGQSTPCNFTTGCSQTSEFTLVCGGQYSLKAWITCDQGSCSNCAACVNIYRSGTGDLVASCTNAAVCDDDDCCEICTTNYLDQGGYVMRVCLVPCSAESQETCCSGACTAWGTISTNTLSCP